MANKYKATNGIVVMNGKYYVMCGDKVHQIRVEGTIKVASRRTPVIAPTHRTPAQIRGKK